MSYPILDLRMEYGRVNFPQKDRASCYRDPNPGSLWMCSWLMVILYSRIFCCRYCPGYKSKDRRSMNAYYHWLGNLGRKYKSYFNKHGYNYVQVKGDNFYAALEVLSTIYVFAVYYHCSSHFHQLRPFRLGIRCRISDKVLLTSFPRAHQTDE